MRRLIRPRATATGSLSRALRGAAGCSALVLLAAGVLPRTVQPPLGESLTSAVPTPALAATPDPGSFRQIILPDLLVVAPQGITGRDLSQLNKITGVRNTIAFDGAEIR